MSGEQQNPPGVEQVQEEKLTMWQEAQAIARHLSGGHEPSVEAVVQVVNSGLLNDLVGAVMDATTELKALREMMSGSAMVAEAIDRITDRMAKAQGARRGAPGPASMMNNPRL